MSEEVTPRTPLASVPASPIEPMIIDRYALFDEIASGGMASVYFGRVVGAAGFTRQVAIKRLTPAAILDSRIRAMFEDEARIGARIHHPNVVQTLDVVSHGDELLLVMEYVHGETLWRLASAARARGLHVPVPIALAIVTEVLQGLHAAHEARSEDDTPLNVVHRDVSPQNIIVGRDGIARVLDFGIARADVRSEQTQDGIIKGKFAYMSPEHLSGEVVTRRSDIFAAGVVLWELLTGRRLLIGGADGESMLMKTLLTGTFDPPSRHRRSIDPALDAIVLCALERDPTARFATASEMARTLEGVSLVATSTQVGEWVQSLAGDTLADRGRKMNAFERADGKRTASRVSLEMPIFAEPTGSRPNNRRRIAMVVGGFALGMAYTAGIAWALQTRQPSPPEFSEQMRSASMNVDSAVHAHGAKR